jgi:hypothetical protein
MAETLGDLIAASGRTVDDIAYLLRQAGGTTARETVFKWKQGKHPPTLDPGNWMPLLGALNLPVSEEGIDRLAAACRESQRLYEKGKVSKKRGKK